MPDAFSQPSEFGGRIQRNGIQPLPHIPTASEKLSLMYRTGDVDGSKEPDGGLSFSGLIPADQLLAIREAEGVSFEKGQEWERIKEAAELERAALAEEIPDL
jgi:hypothetical protein